MRSVGVLRGSLLAICVLVPSAIWAAPLAPAHHCVTNEVPEQNSGVTVVGTYAGQVLEFRVTIDGKLVDLNSNESTKEVNATCAYTS